MRILEFIAERIGWGWLIFGILAGMYSIGAASSSFVLNDGLLPLTIGLVVCFVVFAIGYHLKNKRLNGRHSSLTIGLVVCFVVYVVGYYLSNY